MFNFFANLFGYVLNIIYNLVNNYGIAIIIFTFILKLAMLPISINQQKTLKKSTKVQGKIKEIQEKYSNDPARMNQEMMDVYKQENMSPFSGCLTSIIQIIVILSIFYLISKPLTYMKHVDSELISKYSKEISEQTGEPLRYEEIAIIKEKSEKDPSVSLNMNFLGLDLSDVPSQKYYDIRVYIIPVLYVITSIISTKLTTNLNKNKSKEKNIEKSPDGKQTQEEIMDDMNKQMNIMMPIMSVSIALIAPLGLALYWFVSNILMIAERIIINKMCNEEE